MSYFNSETNSEVSLAGSKFYQNISWGKNNDNEQQTICIFVSQQDNKYTNILIITFCQYKMSLFKFIGFGVFFVRLRGGSVQISFFHLQIF